MSNDSTRYPGLYRRAQRVYASLIEPIRAVAKEHGYAIGVHGSLARDIDLIAAPWIDKPWAAEEMLEAVRQVCEERMGFATFAQDTPKEKPELKPHGRRAWSIILGGGVYLDVSVMPVAVAASPKKERKK